MSLKNYFTHYVQVCTHKALVFQYLTKFSLGLMHRAFTHDLSKFRLDEAEGFSKSSTSFRKVPYAEDSYKDHLKLIGKSLETHYSRSRHHPQHHPEGLLGMNLLDLVEMFYDWAAASSCQERGSLMESIEKNKERFSYGEVLGSLLKNEGKRIKRED